MTYQSKIMFSYETDKIIINLFYFAKDHHLNISNRISFLVKIIQERNWMISEEIPIHDKLGKTQALETFKLMVRTDFSESPEQ